MSKGDFWGKVNNYYGYFAIATLLVGEFFLFMGNSLVKRWFYLIAWWSYIFIADFIVYKIRGKSLWVGRRREFLFMIPWSTFFWLVFECFNFSLKNWHYINVTGNTFSRYPGYFFSYGTVLPGICVTYNLLDTFGIFKGSVRPLARPERYFLPFILIGIAFFVLPIFLPLYFFPLVWGTFIFLLEPINYLMGADSLLKEWEGGSLRRFYLLLLSGLVCGFLWEFWNFWASTKWIYTVPFVGKYKVFEMPILGYLGFPPFAVECYVMYSFVKKIFYRKKALEVLSFALHIPFYLLIFRMIDRFTVVCFIH